MFVINGDKALSERNVRYIMEAILCHRNASNAL